MSLSKPFPLLRLPRLPLFKVFNDIGVQEQFYLSICSSKAKYAIKFYNSRQKFSVTFRFTNNFEFFLKAENSYDKFQIDIQTVTPLFGPMWTFLSSFDVEAPTNVQRLLLFVMDVYNTPTISLVFEERPHDFVSGFINFIQSLKLKIHYLGIRSHNEEDVKFVLDSCREGFSKLHLNCPMFHTEFEYLNKPLTPMFSLDKLIINYAGWVTTRHLTKLFINCKQVLLDRCSLENINVKQLIQTWIYGYSQWNHTWLTFDSIDFSLADIMRGISSTVVPTEEIGWAFRFLGELTIGAYRIQQQKTGVEAYVISYRDVLVKTVSPSPSTQITSVQSFQRHRRSGTSIKLKVQSLKIMSKKTEDVKFVLDNCREGFSEIHLDCPKTTKFEYLNKSLFPKFSVDKLTIKNAEWVTTRHLTKLFINCKHLILDECSEGSLHVTQFIYKWIYGCSPLKHARLTFGHDQTRMRLVESDWLGTRLRRVDLFYGSKYLADIMKTIPSTTVPIKEMGWEFGLLDTKVYRIRQQKTGREAHVFSNCRAIGITDSRLAYPNYP